MLKTMLTGLLLVGLFAATGIAQAEENRLPFQDLLENQADVVEDQAITPEGATDGPAKSDATYLMLKKLLGDPTVEALEYFDTADASAGGATALAHVLGYVAGIAMIVAAIFFVYLVFAGSLVTTSTGEFLGKKWDSYMFPVRAAFGVTLLQPMPGAGPLSIIQVIVLILALLGVGMASALWTASARHLAETPLVTIENPGAAEFAHSIARAQMCLALAYQAGKIEQKDVVIKRVVRDEAWWKKYGKYTAVGAMMDVGGRLQSWNDGDGFLDPREPERIELVAGPDGICGRGTLTVSVPQVQGDFPGAKFKGMNRDLQNHVLAAANAAFPVLEAAIGKLVIKIVWEQEGEIKEEDKLAYFAIVHNFQKALALSVRSGESFSQKIASNNAAFVDAVSANGFALAGAYYWQLERRQDAFVAAIENAVEPLSEPLVISNPSIWKVFTHWVHDAPFKAMYERHMVGLERVISEYQAISNPASQIQTAFSDYTGDGKIGHGFAEATTALAKTMTEFARYGHDGVSAANPNPMMEMKVMGNRLQGFALGLAGVSTAVSLAGNATPAGVGGKLALGSMTSTLGSLMSFAIFALFSLGFIYANIIPAMPIAMWSIAMVGYITYVIMALVASPFWAAMHAHPDGDDFMGRAGSGYPILMTLILHPVLMVVGLIAGMAILRVAGWFFGLFMFDSIQDMNAGGINPTSFFGMLAMWAIVHLVVVYKCMSLTYELPEHVLKWMGVGQQFSDLGEREGSQQAMAIGGVVGGHVRSGTQHGMKQAQEATSKGRGESAGVAAGASGNPRRSAEDAARRKTGEKPSNDSGGL